MWIESDQSAGENRSRPLQSDQSARDTIMATKLFMNQSAAQSFSSKLCSKKYKEAWFKDQLNQNSYYKSKSPNQPNQNSYYKSKSLSI